MPDKPRAPDPFEASEAEAKAWSEAEAAANPAHAPYAPSSPETAAADLRTSVRALGIILVRFEQLLRDEAKARGEQTKAILEHAKIGKAILDRMGRRKAQRARRKRA